MVSQSETLGWRSASGLLMAALLAGCAASVPPESSSPLVSVSPSAETPSPSFLSTSERQRLEADIEELEDEVAALEGQVEALEFEKASLEDQLAAALNPARGPAPTAELTVNWVRWIIPEQPSMLVCVTIENTSDSASLFYSDSQFTAFDGQGFTYPIVINPFFDTVPLQSGELGPGELRRGEVPFNVPQASRPLTRLVWETGIGEASKVTVDLPPADQITVADQC